jgi:hypothetical protein
VLSARSTLGTSLSDGGLAKRGSDSGPLAVWRAHSDRRVPNGDLDSIRLVDEPKTVTSTQEGDEVAMGSKRRSRQTKFSANRHPPNSPQRQAARFRDRVVLSASQAKRDRKQELRRQAVQERLEAEKRERQEARRRGRRVIARAILHPGVVAAFVIAGGAFAAYWVVRGINDAAPVPVGGRLTQVDGIRFVPGAQRDGGISPTCGCMAPPVNQWRGVTFAGRSISLDRQGRSRWTQWNLSSSETAPIVFSPGTRRLEYEAFRIPYRYPLDTDALVRKAREPTPGTTPTRASIQGFEPSLLSRAPLNVDLHGPVPVSAWIPFPGSTVSLGGSRTVFPGEPALLQLVERYPSTIGMRAETDAEGLQGYPLGDFIGESVLWTDDPRARIPGTAFAEPAGDDMITALVLRGGAFATRIGAVPLDRAELKRLFHQIEQHPKRAKSAFVPGGFDGGRVIVTVERPLSMGAYRAMRARLKRDDLTYVRFYSRWFSDAEGSGDGGWGGELERYPPTPANAGFNVFGPLKDVTFRNARGALSIGEETRDFDAPTDIRLTNVHGLRDRASQQLLPLPLSTDGREADLQFKAASHVMINGEEQTSWIRQNKDLVTSLGLIGAGMSLLLGVLGLVLGLRKARG